jgi:S-adenosylmethionine-diacylgycerolhomoserine-N-methlytransferase
MGAFMSMHAGLSADGSHAGLMDAVYRRQRHFYDLTRKYYLLGRDALIGELQLAPGARLVEIGCGTGRNLIAIARRYPGVRLYGLDASAQMLKTARLQLARAGLEEQVILVQGLAEDLAPGMFGQTEFEHVLFSYSLSMIPGWREALFAGAKALSGGGLIHIVDFGDLKTMPGRALLRLWLGLFHVTPRGELLEALENDFNDIKHELRILPGRYAFRLKVTKGKLGTFTCGRTVTG